MEEQERPQFYANDLVPVDITESSLQLTLDAFGVAIQKALAGIESECPPPGAENEDFGTIFSGQLGIAYAFLRVNAQLEGQTLPQGENGHPLATDYLIGAAKARIDTRARFSSNDINPGRPSPITSNMLGALLLRVVSGQWLEQDPKNLLAVMEVAIAQGPTFQFRERPMGVDEILYGRAGLLWSVLEIWKRCPDQSTQTAFAPVFQSIHKLVAAIIDAGRAGAKADRERAEKTDSVNMPLMWSWFDDYFSLGAMHGIAGVLSILLDPTLPRHSISIIDSYGDIAQTISTLCQICIENKGHLPMSVPSRPTSRSAPLVQICHGTPGLLTLLAAAKRNAKFCSQFWSSDWDSAISAASDVLWSEGLLSKGCSLCHGIAGNAWSLLLLVDPLDEKTDGHLAAGLAMLLKARDTPPFAREGTDFRTPDHPWSLFEGAAGLLCAWSEAYCLIKVRLRVLQLRAQGWIDPSAIVRDEEFAQLQQRLFGFPCLVTNNGDTQAAFM